mgnify:CR=1 FL=1
MSRPLRTSERALAAFFAGMGFLHFAAPRPFNRAVPPSTPMPARDATLISGAAEIAGGLGLLYPQTRGAARLGLTALLIAVFPANIYMARYPERFGLRRSLLLARLPLQPLLIWQVLRVGR